MAVSKEVQAILERGAISADDVQQLRHGVFWKGVVTEKDAETAFLLNDRVGAKADPSWAPFFVEALVDYVVWQAEPAGYVSQANADWMIERITRSGHVDSAAELELLVKTLESAKLAPVKLVRFALDQVRLGVLEGKGTIGHNRGAAPGAVSEQDVELLRRMLYAFGGPGNIAVTQQEAEVLFDINDATSELDNHPAWSDLFVKALANFLMASSGYEVPSRQEALRREAWLDAPNGGVGVFMSKMLVDSLQAVWANYRREASNEPRRPADASGVVIEFGPRVTAEEANWAAGRIGKDGLRENEMALINFLKSHGAHLHPKLAPILDLAAA
jgi:hypothetical protein